MAETIEDTKVYYPETIPDVELPEQVSYAQVIDAPQSVSELNTVDGQKLEAIDYNAGNPTWINDVINARIDTAQKNILADWNFGDTDYAGGVYAGDISWNSTTGAITGGSGVVINRAGIIGASGGVTTFAIDATTGDATFSGDITASTVTGGTITGATITGGTIRTASSGARVQLLSSTNTLQILDSSGVVRAESYSNGWQFNNSVGTARGRVFIENTFGNLQLQATSADLFLTAASDITFAPGNGSISMYIDAVTKDLVLNSGDLVLGSTTIAGGGSWTLTLPSTNGSSGQFLQTDGSGNTTWATVSGGATTALSNLASVAINTSLISDTASTDNLGSSGIPWNNVYADELYLTNGAGTIRYNGNAAWDFFASRIELGSTYTSLRPAGAADLGSAAQAWQAIYANSIDLNGGDATNVDQVIGSSGNIDFSISGRVQVSTHFDPTGAGTYNMGGSSRYWAFINTMEITKQGGGGFGWFDDGVTMQDGKVVSDVQGLLAMKADPVKKTRYGKPIIAMHSIPKEVLVLPTGADGKPIKKNREGRYVETVEEKGKMVEVEHTEGENVFAMMSIMMGAIKELALELEVVRALIPGTTPKYQQTATE